MIRAVCGTLWVQQRGVITDSATAGDGGEGGSGADPIYNDDDLIHQCKAREITCRSGEDGDPGDPPSQPCGGQGGKGGGCVYVYAFHLINEGVIHADGQPGQPGDADGDCDVDLGDLGILLAAYGSECPDPDYNPCVDFDDDCDVDLADLGMLLGNYPCQPETVACGD